MSGYPACATTGAEASPSGNPLFYGVRVAPSTGFHHYCFKWNCLPYYLHVH